jgi:anti-sigma factor RsiW
MTRDELIMLYYDGELDADESARVRELVARDPEAKRALARLELIGGVVAEVAEPARSPDVTAAVLAQVLPSGAAGGSVALSDGSRAPRRRPRPFRPLALVSGGLALAAAIAVLLGQPSATDQRVAAPVPVVAAPEPDPPGESVAIERIDFGEDPGAIFLVPGAGERTVVIWTMDEAADNGPEIEL